MSERLALTRVVNACVLVELGGHAVLTDPFFEPPWFFRLREPVGLGAAELPRLAALIGGHGAPDHWQPSSLRAYAHKASTPVLVATDSMRRRARAAGWPDVEVADEGTTRRLSPTLTIEVAAGARVAGMRTNHYLLSTPDVRVYVGTEARDLEPIRRFRARAPAVDVAVLPIDGSSFMGVPLVMRPEAAVEAARILGARALVPFHYALRPAPLLLQTPGTIEALRALAPRDLDLVVLAPGERWSLEQR